MRNAGLEEAQVGIKIAGRNINNLRYADDITLMAESEEELKRPLEIQHYLTQNSISPKGQINHLWLASWMEVWRLVERNKEEFLKKAAVSGSTWKDTNNFEKLRC